MCAAHTPSGLRVRRCWQGRMAAQDFTTRPYEQEEQEEEEEQEEQEEQEEEEGGGRRRWRWCGRVEEEEERSILEVSLLEVFKSNIQYIYCWKYEHHVGACGKKCRPSRPAFGPGLDMASSAGSPCSSRKFYALPAHKPSAPTGAPLPHRPKYACVTSLFLPPDVQSFTRAA
jgi:hypothetical protein